MIWQVFYMSSLPTGQSSMTKVSNIDLWFGLNKAFYDIVVYGGPDNATLYTIYDVCAGADGFPSWIGCATYVSTDYFFEGTFRTPQVAAAQYLVDTKFYA